MVLLARFEGVAASRHAVEPSGIVSRSRAEPGAYRTCRSPARLVLPGAAARFISPDGRAWDSQFMVWKHVGYKCCQMLAVRSDIEKLR
jgi:hypothetical protein